MVHCLVFIVVGFMFINSRRGYEKNASHYIALYGEAIFLCVLLFLVFLTSSFSAIGSYFLHVYERCIRLFSVAL